MNLSKTLFGQTFKTLGLLVFFIAVGLYFDSKYFVAYTEYAQWVSTAIMCIVLLYLYFTATARVKEQIIYAVLIAIIGEYLFSIVLGMYTYRLENVPHYVPPGHAVVFLGVYYFSRKSKVKKYRENIEKVLSVIILIFATYFLITKNDVFGFSLTLLVFYFLRKYPNERLFYLAMYFVVACLELIGTTYQCWWWPATAFDTFSFLPSANPPAGISFFYFGLDRGTMSFYKRRHKLAWARLKRIRAIEH